MYISLLFRVYLKEKEEVGTKESETYFLLVFGLSLFDVFGLPDFLLLLVLGLIASSAPSAVYAK